MAESSESGSSRQLSTPVLIAIIILGNILGAIGFLLITSMWLGDSPLKETMINAHAVLSATPDKELTPKELFLLNELVENGSVVRADEIITTLMSYYESVITTLVSILGLMGVLAFMYVKSVSIEHSEKEAGNIASKTLSNYIKSQEFNDVIHNRLKSHEFEVVFERLVNDLMQDDKDLLQSFAEDMDKRREEWEETDVTAIYTRIAAIEERLSSLDTEEAEDGDKTIHE